MLIDDFHDITGRSFAMVPLLLGAALSNCPVGPPLAPSLAMAMSKGRALCRELCACETHPLIHSCLAWWDGRCAITVGDLAFTLWRSYNLPLFYEVLKSQRCFLWVIGIWKVKTPLHCSISPLNSIPLRWAEIPTGMTHEWGMTLLYVYSAAKGLWGVFSLAVWLWGVFSLAVCCLFCGFVISVSSTTATLQLTSQEKH